MLIVIVASGPQKGEILELSDDRRVTLGREGSLLRLSDRHASRRHAEMWCDDGVWFVRDLGSRHGTFRNNKRVEVPTSLKDGDRIQVGSTVFVVARMTLEQAKAMAPQPEPTPLPIETTAEDPERSPGDTAIAATVVEAPPPPVPAVQDMPMPPQIVVVQTPPPTLPEGFFQQAAAAAPAPSDPRKRRLLYAAAAAAVIALLGSNAVSYYASVQRNEQFKLQILAQLREQPSKDQRLNEARGVVQEQTAGQDSLLRDVLAQLHAQPSRQERVDEVRKVVEQQAALTEPLFKDIFTQLQAQPGAEARLRELRQEIQAQVQTQLHATEPMLQNILAMMQVQPSREQRLAEIREVVESQAAQTDPLFRDIFAQLERYREINVQTFVDAVRGELHAQLEQGAIAKAAPSESEATSTAAETANASSSGKSLAGMPLPTPQPRLSSEQMALLGMSNTEMSLGQLHRSGSVTVTAERGEAGPRAARPARSDDTPADEAAALGLTKLQQAYKDSFESGRRVTIGTTLNDPDTGAVVRGRTLDPGVARRAGIQRWQDWYLLDNYNEQIKLRGQAERFLEDRRQGPAPIQVETPFDAK